VLFDTERVFADGFNKTYARLIASHRVFKGLGARALLFNDTVPNNVLGDWLDIDNAQAEIQPLPMAEIGMEDYKLLRPGGSRRRSLERALTLRGDGELHGHVQRDGRHGCQWRHGELHLPRDGDEHRGGDDFWWHAELPFKPASRK